MSLPAGTQLGPYRILDPLGSGGMGEVYRASDSRLSRNVALKILPPAVAQDDERLRRFELEARAASALNHPNIVAIYDIGRAESGPYVVAELLEGQSLRERLAEAPLPTHKALDFAAQVARGLAAAHDKGIVHRDLKPDNLFITKDGHAKILDFGLAKLGTREDPGSTDSPTMTRGTGSGTVLGTVGYMAPEQVRGRPADHRADIFSFGAVLYEMVSGERAFKGDSAVETMNAILKEDPPDVAASGRGVPPGVDRIIRHCLEKRPEERFQSAQDLAFDLQALSGLSGSSPAGRATVQGMPRAASVLVAALVLTGAVAVLGGRRSASSTVEFQQVTFRRGSIASARFAPDSGSFIYSASWDGGPRQTYAGRTDSPDARSLQLEGAVVRSVAANGEMAVTIPDKGVSNRLARASLGGGALRDIVDTVECADGTRDGSEFAIVHWSTQGNQVEFPIGKVLHVSQSRISDLRISPDGAHVAFIEHALLHDDRGSVAVADRDGTMRVLSEGWASAEGLAWSPDGREIWFTATRRGARAELHAVTLSGKVRRLLNVPGRLMLHDVAPDGRVLLAQNAVRPGLIALAPGEQAERELSWHDFSFASDLSADARQLLFSESGEAGGEHYGVYLRRTDGSPAVRLGEGRAMGLSGDGKWALSVPLDDPPRIVLLPTGAGQPRVLAAGKLAQYQWAGFFPDGQRLLVLGNESGAGTRLYEMDLRGENLRAIAPEGVFAPMNTIAPDGRSLLAFAGGPQIKRYPVDGGEPQNVPGLVGGLVPLRFSADGRSIFIAVLGSRPTRIEKLDVATGRRTPWKQLTPADPAGIADLSGILLSPDGQSYVYNYKRRLSELFLVTGLR